GRRRPTSLLLVDVVEPAGTFLRGLLAGGLATGLARRLVLGRHLLRPGGVVAVDATLVLAGDGLARGLALRPRILLLLLGGRRARRGPVLAGLVGLRVGRAGEQRGDGRAQGEGGLDHECSNEVCAAEQTAGWPRSRGGIVCPPPGRVN